MESYDFEYSVSTSSSLPGWFWPVIAVVMLIYIAAGWRIFAKAGKPGWAILIPIYNIIVMLQIIGRPVWWIILLLIPFVNFIIQIILYIDLAKSFGKGTGFGLGLIFLGFIFFPVLAFGSSQYVGPQGIPQNQ